MTMGMDELANDDPRRAMIEASAHFYRLGWTVGTAGNLSARCADDSFWITASGRHKGTLGPRDFVRVALSGAVLERFDAADKPSAETSIHLALYERLPDARAVYHVHSVESSIVSHLAIGAGAELPPLEMLKGFGIWDHDPQVILPVFDNHADVPRIAQEVRARFTAEPPRVPALLVRGHGATVWAGSTLSALHHVELLEFVFRYMVTARLVGL